jgi:hypothetical protein
MRRTVRLEDPPVHQPMAVLERETSPTRDERRLDVSLGALDDVHRTHLRVGQLEHRHERRQQRRPIHHKPLVSLQLEPQHRLQRATHLARRGDLGGQQGSYTAAEDPDELVRKACSKSFSGMWLRRRMSSVV